MGATPEQGVSDSKKAFEELSGTQLRIFRILELTRRPLRSGELESALGIAARDGDTSCRWLTDNGYIVGSLERDSAAGSKAVVCSLAGKGRSWSRSKELARTP